MPSLEEFPEPIQTMTVSANLTPPQPDDEVADLQLSQQPTQTDRLNNILLKSFLDRMNTGDVNQYMMSFNEEHVDEEHGAEFEE